MYYQAIGIWMGMGNDATGFECDCGHHHRTPLAAFRCGITPDTFYNGASASRCDFTCVRDSEGKDIIAADHSRR